jgi:hypothetical protein
MKQLDLFDLTDEDHDVSYFLDVLEEYSRIFSEIYDVNVIPLEPVSVMVDFIKQFGTKH